MSATLSMHQLPSKPKRIISDDRARRCPAVTALEGRAKADQKTPSEIVREALHEYLSA